MDAGKVRPVRKEIDPKTLPAATPRAEIER
jgi:hypothetical protein